MTTDPDERPAPFIDPGTPEADIAAFVATIRTALGHLASENNGPAGGYLWRWAHRGLWTITAGAVLDPDPVVAGPAGEWRLARTDRGGAVFALTILAGADALPEGVELPRGGLYAGAGVATPAITVPPGAVPYPVQLALGGPRDGDLQPVVAPGGSLATVNLRTGGNFVCALAAGRMAVVIVAACLGLPEGYPVPADLYAPPLAETGARRPPAPRPAYPADRPAARVPGANTGARPGPSWRGDTGGRTATFAGDGQHDYPRAGMGPGAAYAPQIADAEPRGGYLVEPAPQETGPQTTQMDVPPRDFGVPYVAGVDDTGHQPGPFPEYTGGRDDCGPAPVESSPPPAYEPPAAYEPPPAYDGGGYGGDSSPAGGCD